VYIVHLGFATSMAAGAMEYAALGNRAILEGRKLAVFCSVRCPGKLVLQAYDLAQRLRDAGVTVIGGFHSPMEQECLRLLLRGRQPVIVCPARSLQRMRVPAEWKAPIEAGRLLILSPFGGQQRRATADLAAARNAFVASLADELFVAYAEPGGKTERLCREALAQGKPVLTFEASENMNLIALGARPVRPEMDWEQWAGTSPPTRPPAPLFEGVDADCP
jgi:predicted Rossmann fold nucleotide-binding protein DprA/Smf involved in DNA uptake